MSAPATPPPNERRISFALAAISGWVDTAGFLTLHQIFTAHVTGNFVLAGVALAGSGHGQVAVRLSTLLVFFAAVAFWSRRGLAASAVKGMLLTESALLALHGVIGAVIGVDTDGTLFLTASAAVLAMGTQNALMREGFATFLPTTMMTGNTTQFALEVTRYAGGPAQRDAAARARIARLGAVLGGFLVGAGLGALCAARFGFANVIPPVLALLVIAQCQPAGTNR